MQSEPIKKITILGGGTAGWMTVAALSKFFPGEHYQICLIESDQIGTVGVGEATVPHIRYFNNMLGIDEAEFMRATGATFKLGIKFAGWGAVGESYIHPFGSHGYPINRVDFHHYWLKVKDRAETLPFDQFSMAVVAAQANRFDYPSTDLDSLLSTYTYAYHIDAGRYAQYLRGYAEARGVRRIEGKIHRVVRDRNSGDIHELLLEGGQAVEGEFFIDCSGFSALILGESLQVPFDNWSHWLPCDRAVAIPSERTTDPVPYTLATADKAGWRWQIPLQHRTGNGHIYCSQEMGDDEAAETLLSQLEGAPVSSPNFLRFTAGRRVRSWEKNCVAIGLSSGFLEPLESTSIYLIQMGILKLLEFFPDTVCSPILQDEYNQQMNLEYLRIRDFIVLHYKATRRSDTAFWNACRNMKVPESLERKMQLFAATGLVEEYQLGLFMKPSWLAVYLGQGILPNRYDSRLDSFSGDEIAQELAHIYDQLSAATSKLPLAESRLMHTLKASGSQYVDAALSLYGRGSR